MARPPELIRTVQEMRHWRAQRDGVVGFVPTMGALHRGHAQLLRELRPVCESSVLSIFVNPTQFGPQEDLAKYPRTFDEDMKMAQAEGVNAVFYPDAREMYPDGFSTYVEETQISQPLCGRFRPGHFRGVTTIVLKLFQIVQPNVALFGLKDAQQFFVIEKMVRDLNLPIRLDIYLLIFSSFHDSCQFLSKSLHLDLRFTQKKFLTLFETDLTYLQFSECQSHFH
jgi:pantoate--beta-alanine ligase